MKIMVFIFLVTLACSIGVSNADVGDVKGEITYRDISWSDTPEIIKTKIDKTQEYGLFRCEDGLRKVPLDDVMSRHLIAEDNILAELDRQYKSCNTPSIDGCGADSYDGRKNGYLVDNITLSFSKYDNRLLLFYVIQIAPNKTDSVASALEEKYGKGKVMEIRHAEWTKWSNENTVLYFNLRSNIAIYLNYDNLKTIIPKCQQEDAEREMTNKLKAKNVF